MLGVVAAAGESPYRQRATVNGARASAPFAGGEFDFVFSRYSAHHWAISVWPAREVRRVLKPGGVAAFVDVLSPGQSVVRRTPQKRQCCADTSHVRDYSAAEWLRQVSGPVCMCVALRVSACV